MDLLPEIFIRSTIWEQKKNIKAVRFSSQVMPQEIEIVDQATNLALYHGAMSKSTLK